MSDPWTRSMDSTLTSHRALHGDDHINRLIDQAVEEAGELIVALQHKRRHRNSWNDVVGEYADLWLCMEFLRRTVTNPAQFSEMVDDRNASLAAEIHEAFDVIQDLADD